MSGRRGHRITMNTMYQRNQNNSIDEVDEEHGASCLMTLKYRNLPGVELQFERDLNVAERTPLSKLPTMDINRITPSPCHGMTDEAMSMKMESLDAASWNDHTARSMDDDAVEATSEGEYLQYASYAGISVPLAHEDDEFWLSDVQCFIRKHCTEAFSATEHDVTSPKKSGRSRAIDVGQVGIRCIFCRDVPYSRRASQAASFPSHIAGLYSAVVMMQCRHFASCRHIPEEVRDRISTLKQSRSTSALSACQTQAQGGGGGSSGRQHYWIDSGKRRGMVDTKRGIRFRHDPRHQEEADFRQDTSSALVEDLPCLRKTSVSSIESESLIAPESCSVASGAPPQLATAVPVDTLVILEDKRLVPDYLYLAMAQMMPCTLTGQDRVGCYKGRQIGFPGMACMHCGGLPGFGKYFPATVRSLAQTTTSQTVLKHVGAKCKRCPPEVRAALLQMQDRANKAAKDSKPKYGSRKIFFQRLWGRLHNEKVPSIDHLQEDDDQTGEEVQKMRSTDDDMSSLGDDSSSNISASDNEELIPSNSYRAALDECDYASKCSAKDYGGGSFSVVRKRKAETQGYRDSVHD